MTDPNERESLRRAATEAFADSAQPWKSVARTRRVHGNEGGYVADDEGEWVATTDSEEQRLFIALANPAAILRLLDTITSQEAEVARLRGDRKSAYDAVEIYKADVTRLNSIIMDGLCPDATQEQRLKVAVEALSELAAAAERMPKKTPAPGGCGTEHAFQIEAGTIWALDAAATKARAALVEARGEGE